MALVEERQKKLIKELRELAEELKQCVDEMDSYKALFIRGLVNMKMDEITALDRYIASDGGFHKEKPPRKK